MRKVSIFLFSLAILPLLAHGQSCTNNVDTNGNVCTNFTIDYSYSNTVTLHVITQDGSPSDGAVAFNGFFGGGQLQAWFSRNPQNPTDPEDSLTLYNGSVLSAYRQNLTYQGATPATYEVTYVLDFFVNVCDSISCTTHHWNGATTVFYGLRKFVSCGGRGARRCPVYGVDSGSGELSYQ